MSTDEGIVRPIALAVLRLICQFVLGLCLHGEVGRPLTLEDAVNIASGPTVVVYEIGSVRY